jgi:uncharacterized protein (TIGR03118 family)
MWFRSEFRLPKSPLTDAPARPKGPRARRRHPALRLQLDALEDRALPSTFTVLSLADTGPGSLRQAISDANAHPGADVIRFAPAARDGTINLTAELRITDDLTIDGTGEMRLTLSGNGASRVFDINGSTTDVEIDDLTIAQGLAASTTAVGPLGPVTLGGGILNSGAHVTLSGVTMTDNHAVASQTGYVQTNLISDIPGLAQFTDPNLKDPWGTTFSDTGLFSVADTTANVSTLYSVTAAGVIPAGPTVALRTIATTSRQGPTGEVHNDTPSFVLSDGAPATFIYADLNGTIQAWNSGLGTTAEIKVTRAATYTGMDFASTTSGEFLYAANTKLAGSVDVFDRSFTLTSLGPNAFVDPLLPAGLVPFNVEEINGDLYVAYAPAGAAAARSSAPEGAGAVAVFGTSGNFIKQLVSGGKLSSPWGITLAPSSFGQFGGALLVGNFSYLHTEINAFDPVSGAFLGTLTDGSGNPLLAGDNGLWDLTFGNGGSGGLPDTLYFATGLNAEANGLFGAIDPALSLAAGGAVANVGGGTLEVTQSTFTGNEAVATREVAGGAIANDAGSSLTVAHSTFIDNQAIGADAGDGDGGRSFGGGAISNRGGSQAAVSHSTFTGNVARGGNGANGGPAQNGGNGANGAGGAIANLSDSLLVAAAGSTLTVEHTTFTGNQAIGGAGGNGGAAGIGGNGSNGNGGAITNVGAGSTTLVSHSTFTGNQALGGAGGNGGAGKRGGGGGIGQGGAITQFSAALAVEHSTFTDNQAVGGAGGNGGAGANGGAGGTGAGGAINSGVVNATPNILPTLTGDHLMIDDNRATGGRGGDGGSSGNGGNGGGGIGGGIRSRGTLDVAYSLLALNQATGGAGGDRGAGGLLGGNGGLGTGGGITNDLGAAGTVSQTMLVGNQAIGGAGGAGGNGGNGQGGGIWNGTPNPGTGTPSTLTILGSTIIGNRAYGGAAGGGGSAGLGQGGGVYIVPGGTVCVDLVTDIIDNHTSTSDDDVFGILSFI